MTTTPTNPDHSHHAVSHCPPGRATSYLGHLDMRMPSPELPYRGPSCKPPPIRLLPSEPPPYLPFPQKCKCENRAAVLCAAKCGGRPSQTKCPTPTTSTTPSTTSATSSPTPTLCGSRSMPPCDAPYTCIADPNNLGCSLIADCPGLCVRLDGQTCGGFANLQCPAE